MSSLIDSNAYPIADVSLSDLWASRQLQFLRNYVPVDVVSSLVQNGVSHTARLAATENLILDQLLSGSSLPTIDGVAVLANDLVLLTGQTIESENGLWMAGIALPRPDQCNTPTGSTMFITEGVQNAQRLFVCVTWSSDSVRFKEFEVTLDRVLGASQPPGSTSMVVGHDLERTIGSTNTILGCNAGLTCDGDTVASNTLAGYDAGDLLTTGSRNTVVGRARLWSEANNQIVLADGDAMEALHADGLTGTIRLGYNNSVGRNNLIIGNQSNGGADQPGSMENTIVGFAAGASDLTGRGNCCLGSFAGKGLTDGNGNVFLGSGAGVDVVTGSENTFVGAYPGQDNAQKQVVLSDGTGAPCFRGDGTDGSIRVGYDTLLGMDGLVIGNASSDGASTHNVIIGVGSGSERMTANPGDNVIVGNGVGTALTAGAGNILLGSTVATALTTGSNNVLLGCGAAKNVTTGSNNTILGGYTGTAAAAQK
jgi:hypothetical protein